LDRNHDSRGIMRDHVEVRHGRELPISP
jgi:hypothetical protein